MPPKNMLEFAEMMKQKNEGGPKKPEFKDLPKEQQEMLKFEKMVFDMARTERGNRCSYTTEYLNDVRGRLRTILDNKKKEDQAL